MSRDTKEFLGQVAFILGVSFVALVGAVLIAGCTAVPYAVGTAMQAAATSSPFSSYAYHEQYRAQQEQLMLLRDIQQQLMREHRTAGPLPLVAWSPALTHHK